MKSDKGGDLATYTDPTTIIPKGEEKKLETGPILAIVAAVISFLIAGFFFYEITTTKSKTTSVQSQIATEQNSVDSLQSVSQQISTVQNQANALHSIFDNQVQWDQVLLAFQSHLYRNIAVTAMQLDQSGLVTMKGYTPDFTNYAKLYESMTDSTGSQYFSNLKPVSVQKLQKTDGASEIDFIFTFNLTKTIMPIQIAATTQ